MNNNFLILENMKQILKPKFQPMDQLIKDLILKNISANDMVILIDENGKEYSTNEFSKFIINQIMDRTKNLIFIIGGAYGFSNELKELFKMKISLSKLTFSHDMARLFFCEQLYRALTIVNNIPYHNE